jgi:UDP-4-amino-4,6-dideoxy-N-acetyl-beta-L-altrosamine transaminase
MEKFIPYGRQWIDEEDIQAVVETLKSDYLTTGPKISEFETKLAETTGARYAVVFSNGTAALHAACFAAGIGPGDEVITTPLTFAASANCVLYAGGRPVFADIDPRTYNINPYDIRRKITSKTKALIPVHFTGQPCDMDVILDIARNHDLVVIEDGAHALGATCRGNKVGTIGDMTTFSFHPVKHITTGEGGAVTTDSEELYRKLALFRNHGITRDSGLMLNDDAPWYYEQQLLGMNYRLTDIQAALGISQLNKLDYFLTKRREYAQKYNLAFQCFDGIIIPYQLEETESAWHLYVIRLELHKFDVTRKRVFEELRNRGIGVNVHYIPVYYHPYYQAIGYSGGLCPQAEKLYEEIITLPLFPGMKDHELDYVIRNVEEVLDLYRAI